MGSIWEEGGTGARRAARRAASPQGFDAVAPYLGKDNLRRDDL